MNKIPDKRATLNTHDQAINRLKRSKNRTKNDRALLYDGDSRTVPVSTGGINHIKHETQVDGVAHGIVLGQNIEYDSDGNKIMTLTDTEGKKYKIADIVEI